MLCCCRPAAEHMRYLTPDTSFNFCYCSSQAVLYHALHFASTKCRSMDLPPTALGGPICLTMLLAASTGS